MAYVREIVFINPPGEGEEGAAPTSTSMSINLSLAQYVYVYPPTTPSYSTAPYQTTVEGVLDWNVECADGQIMP
jgi:hypothetical protein